MIIVLQVNAPMHMAQGIKEALAMQLERYGDIKVLEIREDKTPKQEEINYGTTAGLLIGGQQYVENRAD